MSATRPRWIMILPLLLTPLAVCSAQEAPHAAPDSSGRVATAPLLASVVAKLETGGAFQTDFRQINHWIAFDEPDTADGVLTLQASSRFRLEYRNPSGHLVGCDGAHVWSYVPEEFQVLRSRLQHTTGWGEFFYRGLQRPADTFAVMHRSSTWGDVARIPLEGLPEWSLSSLYIEVAVGERLPVGYGYTDEEGNQIDFQFSAPRFPNELSDSLFIFTVPPGYELFEID